MNFICKKLKNESDTFVFRLSCQNSMCECSSTQFWSTSSSTCVNHYTYNSGICTADNQCTSNTNLICRKSGTSCNCPSTVANNGKCDCTTPISGKEYYWNGSSCTSALSYNQSCTFNNMCQTLTELTICSGTPSKCICNSNSYWSYTQSKCLSCLTGWLYHRLFLVLHFMTYID